MTTTHAPKTVANIFQSRRPSTSSSSSKWHPNYTRPKAPVKYAPAYGSSSSSSLMRNINRMKRPSYQCRTGIHGPKPVGPGTRKNKKSRTGPGPRKMSKSRTGLNQDQQNFVNLWPIRTGPWIPDAGDLLFLKMVMWLVEKIAPI